MQQVYRPASCRIIYGWTGLLAVALAFAPHATLADDIRLGGFWYENVTILDFEENQIVYSPAVGGEVRQNIREVQGLRLQAHPQMEQGLNALQEGEFERAITALQTVASNAREGWIRQFATWKLMEAQEKADKPVDAVKSYVALVRMNAQPVLVEVPPLDGVDDATQEQRREIIEAVRPALGTARGEPRRWLERIKETAEAGLEMDEAPADGPAPPRSPRETPQDEAAADSVILPQSVTIRQPTILNDLRRGRFQDAVQRAEQSFSERERYAEKFYLLGLARLGLAEASGRAEDYKDAALTFMRLDIHYPNDALRDFALVEVAYCHVKFARPDIARKLLDEVGSRGRITSENNPDYHQRIQELDRMIQIAEGRG